VLVCCGDESSTKAAAGRTRQTDSDTANERAQLLQLHLCRQRARFKIYTHRDIATPSKHRISSLITTVFHARVYCRRSAERTQSADAL